MNATTRKLGVDLGSGIILPAATDVVRYPTRDAWLAARPSFLGGSAVAQVLGLSPYGGQWDVFGAKCLSVRNRIARRIADRGHREEPRILEDYQAETGHRYVGPLGETVVFGADDWMGFTPDCFIFDESWGLGEVKTDRSDFRWGQSSSVIERWDEDAARIVREDYACQVYFGLAVTGLPWARLVVRRSLDDLRWFTLVADPRIQRTIVDACGDFWAQHIETQTPPAVDDSAACERAMARLFPAGDKVLVPATADDLELVEELERIDAEMAAADSRRQAVRNQLAQRIGKAYGLSWPSSDKRKPHKVLWQSTGGGQRFDEAAFAADHPDLHRQYRRQVQASRTIRVYRRKQS